MPDEGPDLLASQQSLSHLQTLQDIFLLQGFLHRTGSSSITVVRFSIFEMGRLTINTLNSHKTLRAAAFLIYDFPTVTLPRMAI